MANPADFHLRRAQRSDLPRLLAILEPLRSTAFNWSEISFRGEFEYAQTWVYERSEDPVEICALICLRDAIDAWEISIVATAQKSQNQGIMEAFLKSLIVELGGRRHLWLEVHEDNVKAQNLYQKLGFATDRKRGGYYSDGSAALVMSLAASSLKP